MLEKKEVISIVFLCTHHVCELFHVLGKKKKLAKKKLLKKRIYPYPVLNIPTVADSRIIINTPVSS